MNHNLHKISCRVVQQTHYYSACQAKYRKVKARKAGCTNPSCVTAIEKGLCPAAKMIVEEMTGQARYYLDRDDAGPGIVSRAELGLPPRTQEEIDRHRKIAADNKVKVIIPDPVEKLRQIAAYRRWQESAAGWTPSMTHTLRRSGLDQSITAPVELEAAPVRRITDPVGDSRPAEPRQVVDLNDIGAMVTAAVAEEAAHAAA